MSPARRMSLPYAMALGLTVAVGEPEAVGEPHRTAHLPLTALCDG